MSAIHPRSKRPITFSLLLSRNESIHQISIGRKVLKIFNKYHSNTLLLLPLCFTNAHIGKSFEKQSVFLNFLFAEAFLGIQQTYAMVILCCSCDFRRLIQFVPICRGFAFRPVHTNGILSGGEFSAPFPYRLFTSCLR